METNLQFKDYEKLLECQSSRSFLKVALSLQYKIKQRPLNISDFSRQAGFHSRSYISELLSGKKGWSYDSFLRVRSKLTLPRYYKKLFDFLVLQENSNFPIKSAKRKSIDEQAQEIKEKICEEQKKKKEIKKDVVSKAKVISVYAALGSVETGASIEDIASRTGYGHQTINKAVKCLENSKLLEFREGRVYAKSSALDLLGLKSQSGLAELSSSFCENFSKKTDHILEQKSGVSFFTSFSMNSYNLEKFKTALQESILGVIDEFQDDNGDSVQQLFAGSVAPRDVSK